MKINKKVNVFLFSTAVLATVAGTQVSYADEIIVQEPTVVVEETVAEVNNNITEVAPAEVQPVNEVSVEVKTAEVAELPVVEVPTVAVTETPQVEEVVVKEVTATEQTPEVVEEVKPSEPTSEAVIVEEKPSELTKQEQATLIEHSPSSNTSDKEETRQEASPTLTEEHELEFKIQELLEKLQAGEIGTQDDWYFEDTYTRLYAKESIPSSGTYRFKKSSGVKNEPKISSPDLATYAANQTVNYDRVLEADGHQWISYISYSGVRRYVAINALATAATASNNKTTPPKTTTTVVTASNGIRLSVETNQVKDKTKLMFAVWSEVNDQDDLKWYTADKNGKYVVNYNDHKGTGNYHVQTYSVETGSLVILNSTTFSVTQSTLNNFNKRQQTTKPKETSTTGLTIPPSGTFYFGTRAGVKAEPKLSSPDLAYYDKDMSVNYDSVLNAEGKQWISYLSYDGSRRYVAVSNATTTQSATTSTTSTPKTAATAATQTLPSSGTYYFNKRAGIKEQPKASSPEVAYYDKGMSVNYDSTLTSEGKQWISYLSYAGGRYYIAVDSSTGTATKPSSTPATQPATSPAKTTTANQLTSPNARPQYHANTYPLGQCTWGAKEAASWVNNYWGNANQWVQSAKNDGFTVGTTPTVGAVAVWPYDGDGYGHVAVVTQVTSETSIQVVESNLNGNQYLANFRGKFNPKTSGGGVVYYIYPPAK